LSPERLDHGDAAAAGGPPSPDGRRSRNALRLLIVELSLDVTPGEWASTFLRRRLQALRWSPADPESRTPARGYSQGFFDRAGISQLLVVLVLSGEGSSSSSQRSLSTLMTHRVWSPVLWAAAGFQSHRWTGVAPRRHLIRHRCQAPSGTVRWLGNGRLRSWQSSTLRVGPGAAGHRVDVSSL